MAHYFPVILTSINKAPGADCKQRTRFYPGTKGLIAWKFPVPSPAKLRQSRKVLHKRVRNTYSAGKQYASRRGKCGCRFTLRRANGVDCPPQGAVSILLGSHHGDKFPKLLMKRKIWPESIDPSFLKPFKVRNFTGNPGIIPLRICSASACHNLWPS
jgi:hypothetical protein